MNQPTYLMPWLDNWNWGKRFVLFFILLSALIEFVAFALSQNYVVSYLGAQPEDVSFSIQICYAGILSALPLQPRLLCWVEMKYYLLGVMIVGISLSVACIYTTDIILFFIIRFFQGTVVCSIAACMLTLIQGSINVEQRLPLSSTIFYGTVLSSSAFAGIIASQISLNSDFTTLYDYLIYIQLITIVIVIVGFNNFSNIRRYPLYQVDWVGCLFIVCTVTGAAYTMVYGSKYYWFNDNRILLATVISITGAVLFIYRSLILKRPLLDLSVFTFPKFWLGLALLAVYYGSKESINVIFSYTSVALQWSAPEVIRLALLNAVGLIITMATSIIFLIRSKQSILGFLIIGFSCSLCYHIWVYQIFTPDLSFSNLAVPVVLQGISSGLLFVPIMIFILSSVPPTVGITGLVVAGLARFASLLNAGAGFYNLQLYYSQLYKESFLNHLTVVDPNTIDRVNLYQQLFISKGLPAEQAAGLANASLTKAMAVQVQILSGRATFLFIAEIIRLLLLLIAVVYLFQLFYSKSEPKT